MSEMRRAAVSIIREHIEDLETHEIDQLIFQAFPRITPVDMAAIWGEYLEEAKIELQAREDPASRDLPPSATNRSCILSPLTRPVGPDGALFV
jgi:hypothetical protein